MRFAVLLVLLSLILTPVMAASYPPALLEKLLKTNPKQFITYSPESPKAIVMIFTDPSCGYCRKLHQDIEKLNNLGLELRFLAFPRQEEGSPIYNKMVSIWCADDPKAAMDKAMQGERIPELTCRHQPVAAQKELGLEMGVPGTPTIIFPDGTTVPGYLPPEKLAKEAMRHQGT